MKVYFSTWLGEKASVEVDDGSTVESLRTLIVSASIARDRRSLPEDEASRTRLHQGDQVELYLGPLRMENGRLLSEYGLKSDAAREIVVHPRWKPGLADLDREHYLVYREDSEKAGHLVESLAILDPDWWLECGQCLRESWRERQLSIIRHWNDGQLKAAVDRAWSSPYWPLDYRPAVSRNT